VDDLICGKNLSRQDSRELFRLTLKDEQPDLQKGAAKARDILDSERPIRKLRAWVAEQNSGRKDRLEQPDEMMSLGLLSLSNFRFSAIFIFSHSLSFDEPSVRASLIFIYETRINSSAIFGLRHRSVVLGA